MAKRNTHSLTVSLCVSLIVHGLGLSAIAWYFVMTTPPPKWAAIDRNQLLLQQLAAEMTPPPPLIVPPKPKPKPKPPAPAEAMKLDNPAKDDSGEHDGVGKANRTNHGEPPMQARAGRDQADLMNADATKFDPDLLNPASAGKGEDTTTASEKRSIAGQNAPQINPSLTGKDDKPQATVVALANSQSPTPVPVQVDAKNNSPKASGQASPASKQPTSAQPKTKSERKQVVGHKAEASDTESIAFAENHPAMFRAGRLEGRQGLKVKTTIPQLGFASRADARALPDVVAVLRAKVDVDGVVQDVEILQSSGSANIDEDIKLAILNEWNLEPRKDKDGNPDSLYWVIRFE
jgi:hypothetical protein